LILTEEAKKCLNIITYELKSSIPFINQGPIESSKTSTTQAASICLFGNSPLIYALSDQTKILDLIGLKLSNLHFIALVHLYLKY
jgi:hypothetical protein